MYEIDLVDETFDINRLNNYSLSVKISDNSLAYSLFDSHTSKHVLLRSTKVNSDNNSTYTQNLQLIIDDDEVINKYKADVRFVLYSTKTIIVPNAFYSKDKEAELLNFNINLSENDEICRNKLRNGDYNIFCVDGSLFKLINKNFKSVKIYNQASVVVNESLLNLAKDRVKLIIDTNTEFIDVTLFTKGNLSFKNTFEYKSSADFVFFILNIYDKFELQPDKVDLLIMGTVTSISDEVLLLNNYIKKIKFLKTSLNYSYIFNDIKISIFTNLLNLQNCV